MLVLSRQQYESILIGNEIEITVVEITSGRVKLGITAPKPIQIDRLEVRESKDRKDDDHDRLR